jgi:hypothetical protein
VSLPIKYSYSGADCRAVAYFEDSVGYGQPYMNPSQEIIPLDSLATISYSIYEAKSPVRRLGDRGVNGYTRGIRTIAGSMVFLVIEDHPLSRLVELGEKSKNWSRDLNSKGHSFRDYKQGKKRFISTLLPPFNIGLFYKTEVAFRYNDKAEAKKAKHEAGYVRSFTEGAHLVISGIDIISEGMVTSVNDMVTEVTMQFVAQDAFNVEKAAFNKASTTTGAVSGKL